jgi:origin recognition complex subunit 5
VIETLVELSRKATQRTSEPGNSKSRKSICLTTIEDSAEVDCNAERKVRQWPVVSLKFLNCMEDESSIIEGLSDANPGYEELISQLYTTLSSASPPFIYITDSVAPRITANTTRSILQALRDAGSDSHRTRFAQANAVACVTPRLLYDTILNGLAGWNVDWANGCENWTVAGNEQRWNDSMDGFLHGLQAVANTSSGSTETTRKGKRKVGVRDNQRTRMVVTIERAEKLKETLPDLIVPLTRLGELVRTFTTPSRVLIAILTTHCQSRVEITTIFISCARWEDIRPSLGASPDPYFLDIPPPTKQGSCLLLSL